MQKNEQFASLLNKFKGKRVLVTGHSGFKGAWLSLWLIKLGAYPIGYSLESDQNPNLFEILDLAKHMPSYISDIRDAEKISQVIKDEKPEIIFHMAAQALVRKSYKEPKYTYETNVMGTVNLFESVRNSDHVRTIINITTDKCYENIEKNYAYKETDQLGGYDPYSSSKACAELVSAAYRNSFFKESGIALATVRAGNVIGGGDWSEDRLVPDCIRALTTKKEIVIRNPQAIRPWQYVLEPLLGYLVLAAKISEERNSYNEAWNFGPLDSSTVSVDTLVSKLINKWGEGSYTVDKSEQPHEANLLMLDLNKTNSRLGYSAIFNIDEALDFTVGWYHNYYAKSDMKSYSLLQIEDYLLKQERLLNKASNL